jgi:hypothetical protein
MNNFDLFSGNIFEFFLDGFAYGNDPVRVIEELVHQRFVDKRPVMILPYKVPEMTDIWNSQISGSFHAGTGHIRIIVYDIDLLFLQNLLDGFDRKKIQHVGVHRSFTDIFDHIFRVRRRGIRDDCIPDSSFFQLRHKSAPGICDDERLVFTEIQGVKKIQKRIGSD